MTSQGKVSCIMIVRMVNTLQIVWVRILNMTLTWPQHVHVHFGGLMVMGPCTIILEFPYVKYADLFIIFLFFSVQVSPIYTSLNPFFLEFWTLLPRWCESWNESNSWAQMKPKFHTSFVVWLLFVNKLCFRTFGICAAKLQF
jgi:hypothetical protein